MEKSFRRMRRLRRSESIRSLVQEHRLSAKELVYPIFVVEGKGQKLPVESMPGVYQYSPDRLPELLEDLSEKEIRNVLLFGIPAHKDEVGSEAYAAHGIAQEAVRTVKRFDRNFLVISDVCLCEYTSHGHCGLIRDGEVLNDETLPLLAKASLTLADAGADVIAPSDMMDGRIRWIRSELDENGFANTPIMSYSAKFASAYYAPFRDAAHSAPAFGDRRSYQMDPPNGREAVRECLEDIEEGADIVMVKPALPYLDVLKTVRETVHVPVAAYNVSGEYAMVRAAAERGWIDEKRVVLENMMALRRAGAGIIITYHAPDVAEWLRESH